MPKMRVVQVSRPGAPLELVQREVPQPGPGQVRVRVEACGICHSDVFAKDGHWPGIRYPIVPGHEVVGIIDAVGSDTDPWQAGQRVGIGWHGGHCRRCEPCRRGDFVSCRNLQVPGLSYDGGYAEQMIAPSEALALIPPSLAAAEAAPLLCAGITTYNALRHSRARAGDRVAILGIGGLGHLAVQFAAKMGFHTIAIARGSDKEPLARQLGAHHYIDSARQDVAAALTALGGASVVLATAASAKAMTAVIDGLAVDGRRLGGSDRGDADPADRRSPVDPGLAVGHVHRFRGHAGLQRAQRRAADDRDHAAGAGGRGLREDGKRRGTVPHGIDHGLNPPDATRDRLPR